MLPTSYHQLGRFVVSFQHVEYGLTEIIILLAEGDEESIRIIVHDLDFVQRIKVASTLFTRFVDLRADISSTAKEDFYTLLKELEAVGKRRNDLVHSRYVNLRTISGAEGLLRTKQRRELKAPSMSTVEESLMAESFEPDFLRLAKVRMLLENVRLNLIDWLYPDQ